MGCQDRDGYSGISNLWEHLIFLNCAYDLSKILISVLEISNLVVNEMQKYPTLTRGMGGLVVNTTDMGSNSNIHQVLRYLVTYP